jgi:hypothetical protein
VTDEPPADLLAEIKSLAPAELHVLTSVLARRADEALSAAKVREHASRWGGDPAAWVRERLGEHVWSKQSEIMHSVAVNRRTAVRSGHAVGKSHVASRVACWWLDTHEPGEAFVVSTAPSYAQVRAILWRYIRQAHSKARLPGRLNQTEWFIGDELVAYGRKPSDTDETGFQGIHARFVLVLIDEACGIPEQLWIAADSLTTNADCRTLAIGNPDNPSAHFRTVTESQLWNQIKIAAQDTPNFTGEPVPRRLAQSLVSPEWVQEKRLEWGEDNPLYRSKVLAEFSADSPVKVIRFSDLQNCRREPDVVYGPAELLPVELGVDVAGGGSDETVIRERRGIQAGREWRYREDDPERVADAVLQAVLDTGASAVKIDSTGIGWGLVGLVRAKLRAAATPARVIAVNASQAAPALAVSATDGRPKEGFINVRAAMWWNGRVLAQSGGFDLSAMDNADATIAQLSEPTWDVNAANGKIRIEPKDEVTRRLGRSPDNADALLLAYWTAGGQGGAFTDFWRAQAAAQAAPAAEAARAAAASGPPRDELPAGRG